MDPSIITITIDREVKFNKFDLEALKDSDKDSLFSIVYSACSVSNVQYYLYIMPNGNEKAFLGDVCIFFSTLNGNAVNVDSEITLSVETAKFKNKMKKGFGALLCKTTKFFDSKFFKYGQMVVKVEGKLTITLPKKIRYPFSGQWKIKQNDLEDLRISTTNEYLQSKRFYVSSDSNTKYYLKLYPNGNKDKHRGETWIYLFVCLDNVTKLEAVYNIEISSNNLSWSFQDVYSESQGCGVFLSLTDDLFKHENGYFVDGELVLKVSGTFLIDNERNELTSLVCKNGVASKAYQKHRGKEFTIIAGGKNIKVHKKVLIEASPVFEAMFNSGMKEVTEKKMIIPDFSIEIVGAALKLLYSDAIPSNFTFEQVLSLLQFADKYDINLILDLVQEYLIQKISPNNVCCIINFCILTAASATKLYSNCVRYLLKCSEEKKAIHGLDTLDKDFVFKMFMETFSRDF